MKYEAIRIYSSEFSVRKMCKVLGLKTAAYHNWRRRLEKREEKKKEEILLAKKVREIFEENKKVYGYRKMWRALNEKGIELSEYKVKRIMNQNGMYPLYIKKFKHAGSKKSDGRYFEDAIKQEFLPPKPNMVWAGDITYIKTNIGWVYLAAVMDLFNKEIIGYSISKVMDTELESVLCLMLW